MNKIVENWKQGWKFYSVWAFAVLSALPDLFNMLRDAGLFTSDQLPDGLAWTIRIIAVAGLVSRFVSQKKPDGAPPEIG